ncbi:hypothetical protein XH96_31080 [Bradyrhizobium sp. CCBAU 51765]|nr:hypothetical protein XH96_31080 [Bradyrhizobium sp. CCBAU 51765]
MDSHKHERPGAIPAFFSLLNSTASASSLRAKRSNPGCHRGKILDCLVASAPRNDGGGSGHHSAGSAASVG